MLSNLSQYSPQGLIPQFPGLQTAGLPDQLNPWLQNPGAHSPLQSSFGPLQGFFGGHAGVNTPVQQIVPVLAQLAQQIAVQAAVAQQIGVAVHQLAQQLAVQSLQNYPGAGFGSTFTNTAQGGYGGISPQQAQAWGVNRPQTIQ